MRQRDLQRFGQGQIVRSGLPRAPRLQFWPQDDTCFTTVCDLKSQEWSVGDGFPAPPSVFTIMTEHQLLLVQHNFVQ